MRARTFLGLSLLFPLIALTLFHGVNCLAFGFEGGFLFVPFRFVFRILEFRLEFPEGFFTWMLRTAVGIIPIWLLGWGLLGNTLPDRIARFLVAFPVGIGLTGVAIEFLAMGGILTATAVWLLYALSAAAGLALVFRSTPNPSEPGPEVEPCGWRLRLGAWGAFALLCGFSFLHALFYPENYWDSLLYYLYYPKLVFQSHGIPFPTDPNGFEELVQCQVGLGIGANYPPLFRLWQAATCIAFGEWSPFPGQWFAPLAGLATALLVYRIARSRWRSERVGLWAMVLVQSVPYWLFYQNWVSDYPLAVWLTVAGLALLDARPSRTQLTCLILIAAAGCHLNYLMASLWLFPLIGWGSLREEKWSVQTAILFLIGMALSSSWFIRNEVVTGNPVYAFFPEIFGGIHIDPEVLRSCQVEWIANGDGLSQVGSSLWGRILGTPRYFLFDPNTSAKWATLPLGWFLPGLIWCGWSRRWDSFRLGLAAYGALLFFYEYAISSFYLYHVMSLVPLMALAACGWMSKLDRMGGLTGRFHTLLVLLVAGSVGLPAAMMGAKYTNPGLEHTLHPGTSPEAFLSLSLPEYSAWEWMNARLPEGAIILTHDNRHYYLRDDLKLIHLDDYRLVPYYGKSGDVVLSRLRELGVGYYLRIANEKNHPITRRLGLDRLLAEHFDPLYERGETRLYRLRDSVK
ncbi:MAG: hypothetical protein HUU16_03860 [Candidatus Omnitrophica bacterium]|nr:hypothetical protein [bacterium]NUN95286.1 hypothetical protein [Candidatus Omnitrophota bacterium]